MRKKIMLGIAGALLVLGLGAFLVFKLFVAQGVTRSYEINNPQEGYQNILIATQKKAFKDSVMNEIVAYYQDKPVYIQVVDVTKLDEINREEWDKIILFTTVEMGKIPSEVTEFLSLQDDLSGIFMPVTAGSGIWNGNIYGVDMVATASKTDNVQQTKDEIIHFIGRYEV